MCALFVLHLLCAVVFYGSMGSRELPAIENLRFMCRMQCALLLCAVHTVCSMTISNPHHILDKTSQYVM
jgi:hypothetical protein